MVNLPSDRWDDVPGVVEKGEVDNIFLACMHQRRRIPFFVTRVVGKYLAPGYEATGRQWPYTGAPSARSPHSARGAQRLSHTSSMLPPQSTVQSPNFEPRCVACHGRRATSPICSKLSFRHTQEEEV